MLESSDFVGEEGMIGEERDTRGGEEQYGGGIEEGVGVRESGEGGVSFRRDGERFRLVGDDGEGTDRSEVEDEGILGDGEDARVEDESGEEDIASSKFRLISSKSD